MQIKVLASTKVGYTMPKEEAINFSGKSAGICYMPDSMDTLFSEPTEKTETEKTEEVVKEEKNETVSETPSYVIEEKPIIGIGGIYDGVKITVGKEMYIGRNPEKCSVIYPEGTRGISSIHCCIRTLDGKIELTDMGSTCGTFLKNGEKLESNVPCLLEMGDVFYIAEQENSFLVK